MKKSLLLSAFFLGAVTVLFAQTVTVQLSGTVLRDSTHLPVPNHVVVIQADSNSYGFSYYATRSTNANGFYDCIIHNVPATGAAVTFVVKTKDCDSTDLIQTFHATNTPVTVNFLLCNGNLTGCEAGFHSVHDSVNPFLIHFYDYSSSQQNIVVWTWNFGDGSSSTVSYPANPDIDHLYSEPGTYSACLTIETADSCVSTVCHEVVVGQNTQCQAHYHYQSDSVNVMHVHFWDISTPQNLVVSRYWTFGDPASGSNNTAITGDPWHIFTAPGKYDVCLSIATSTGCTSVFCDSINVGYNATSCENWMTYTSSGLTFTFEGHTSSPYPAVYTWNFGDGTPAVTGQTVQHTYLVAGSYNVSLHTVDSVNCEWNRTQTVYVQNVSYSVFGHASLSNTLYVDHALAELIRSESGVMVTADSQEFGDSAGMYWFGGVLPGHYYVRVTLLPSSAYYGQFAPTYHYDAICWGNANLIELGQPNNPYNVVMQNLLPGSGGNGTVTGAITQTGKYNGNGVPAPDVEVLLLDGSGQAMDYTMTDANGEFTFTDLAFGTYQIYPEMIGKTTTSTTVVLDANQANASVVFAIQGGNISGIPDKFLTTGMMISDVFPNPVTTTAGLTIRTDKALSLKAGIFSLTGSALTEWQIGLRPGTNQVLLPVSELKKGMYYVKIECPDGKKTVKKFIITR